MNASSAPSSPLVGILGGMGPAAGLDLISCLLEETDASRDDEHVDSVLFSMPSSIGDRTAFLNDPTRINPGIEMGHQIVRMETIGVTVAAIACNTAHAPPIFEAMRRIVTAHAPSLVVLHMIEETVQYVRSTYGREVRTGVLATAGTLRLGLYEKTFASAGIESIAPEAKTAARIHDCIYNDEWGIKAVSGPASERARECVLDGLDHLKRRGADLVVLGCTELPLAAPRASASPLPLVNPARIVARALLGHARPDRLKSTEPIGPASV